MKKLSLGIFAALLFSTTSIADDASRLELANEVAQFVSDHTNYEEMIGGMSDQTLEQFATMGLPSATPEQADKIRAIYLDKLTEPFKTMMEDVGPIYANIYTEEELQAMFDFYQTPLGTAVVEKNAKLALDIQAPVMELVSGTLPAMMPEVMAILQN